MAELVVVVVVIIIIIMLWTGCAHVRRLSMQKGCMDCHVEGGIMSVRATSHHQPPRQGWPGAQARGHSGIGSRARESPSGVQRQNSSIGRLGTNCPEVEAFYRNRYKIISVHARKFNRLDS